MPWSSPTRLRPHKLGQVVKSALTSFVMMTSSLHPDRIFFVSTFETGRSRRHSLRLFSQLSDVGRPTINRSSHNLARQAFLAQCPLQHGFFSPLLLSKIATDKYRSCTAIPKRLTSTYCMAIYGLCGRQNCEFWPQNDLRPQVQCDGFRACDIQHRLTQFADDQCSGWSAHGLHTHARTYREGLLKDPRAV